MTRPHLNQFDVSDDNGHGSVVAAIIHDLCPSAALIVYKVADKNGRASEWDTLAALAASVDAGVINISLAFGLPDIKCSTCGRESRSSRSAVFENLLSSLDNSSDRPIIVGAAGNNKQNELAFPARFGNVLAIESIDQGSMLSSFSNWSNLDQEGKTHLNVFVLPGGQKGPNNQITEYVAISAKGHKYYGTSFSAAYASGIVTALWSEPVHISEDSTQVLNYLRANADKNIINYDPTIHGNGMMRLL